MTAEVDVYGAAIDRAVTHARAWLKSIPGRSVPPRASIDELAASFGRPLPDSPMEPGAVIDLLAKIAEPGLMAMGSGRFFGWVIGGTLPAALGADWLVSARDQNSEMRYATPATVGAEEAAATDDEDVAATIAAVRRAATM